MSAKSSRVGLKLFVVLLVLSGAAVATVFYLRPIAKVHIVTKGTAANVVHASVVVEPGVVSQITSEAEGRLKMSTLKPGATMKEGDVVAEIDTGDVDLEIARAENDLKAAREKAKIDKIVAESQWLTTEEDFEEAKRQYSIKNLTELEMKRRQRAFDLAKEQRASDEVDRPLKIATLENALKVAESKKKKMRILAPFDGVVTQVFVNLQDLVPAKQPLATVIPHSRLVKAKIAEADFPLVMKGQKAKVSLQGYAGKIFDATVNSKLPSAEPGTQRYSALLDVEMEPGNELFADMTGDAAITIDEHPDVTVVPARAVVDGVAVLKVENGRVRLHHPEIGYRNLVKVEVKTQIVPGDQVIVEDLDRFRDGQRVRVVPEK